MLGEKRKDLIEVTGALAIVVSLVFVGFEIRQNTDAVRSTVAQAVSQQSYDAIVLLIENSDLRAAWSTMTGTPRDDHEQLLSLYYGAMTRVQLNRYAQVKLGVIEMDTVLAMAGGGGGGFYNTASFRKYWSLHRDRYDPNFVSYMEEMVFPE